MKPFGLNFMPAITIQSTVSNPLFKTPKMLLSYNKAVVNGSFGASMAVRAVINNCCG